MQSTALPNVRKGEAGEQPLLLPSTPRGETYIDVVHAHGAPQAPIGSNVSGKRSKSIKLLELWHYQGGALPNNGPEARQTSDLGSPFLGRGFVGRKAQQLDNNIKKKSP
jgi:hypothetical protein